MPKHWSHTALLVASGVATAAASLYLASLYATASQHVEDDADRRKRGYQDSLWQHSTCMHTSQPADVSLIAGPSHNNSQQQLQHEQHVQDSCEPQQQQTTAAASPDPPPTPAAQQQHRRLPAQAPDAAPCHDISSIDSAPSSAPLIDTQQQQASAVALASVDLDAVGAAGSTQMPADAPAAGDSQAGSTEVQQASPAATSADALGSATEQEAPGAAAAVQLQKTLDAAALQPNHQQQQQECEQDASMPCQQQQQQQQQRHKLQDAQAGTKQPDAQRQFQPLPSPPQSPKASQTIEQQHDGWVDQQQQQQTQQRLQQDQQQASQQQQQQQQHPDPREPVQQQLLWSGIQRQRSATQRISLDSGLGAAVQHSTAGTGDVPHKQHRSFNTARHAPSLDTTVASAAVTRNLGVQYKFSSTGSSAAAASGAGAAGEQQGSLRGTAAAGRHSLEGPILCSDVDPASDQNKDEGVSSLAASCAALCVQHCAKLQAAEGRETTVLDIGCGTGGCCFELAASFSHVLGIDGDLLNITAAKELKAHGELCFRPLTAAAEWADAAGVDDGRQQQEEEGEVFVVRVPDVIDRDRVRFWHCPLPQLPPKLAPVDGVLVEDVDGHLGPGLHSVCEQLPLLLNPEGVCVVVLGVGPGSAVGGTGDAGGAGSIQGVGGGGAAAGGDGGVTHESVGDGDARVEGCVEGSVGAGGAASLQDVKAWLGAAGLRFVQEVWLQYSSGGSLVQAAHAGVWLQQ